MSPTAAAIVVVLALACAAAWGLGALLGTRGEPVRDWVSMHTRHRKGRRVTSPEGRPFEDVVAEVRRLGARFHTLDRHASYAKAEAVRAAYDRVLDECCATLGITHLLAVLPPGPPLDAERRRVEELLGDAGVRLPFAA